MIIEGIKQDPEQERWLPNGLLRIKDNDGHFFTAKVVGRTDDTWFQLRRTSGDLKTFDWHLSRELADQYSNLEQEKAA